MLYKSIRRAFYFAIFTCSMIFMPQAHANYFSGFNKYFGLAAGYQHVGYKDDYGAGFFPNNTTDYELYYGMQHINKFGFEFGLSYTPDVRRNVQLNAGDKFPGTSVPLVAGTYEVWESSYDNSSIYFGVNRYYSFNPTNNFRGFIMIGAAFASVQMETNLIDTDLPGPPSAYMQAISYNSFSSEKLIPMLKLGLEYDFGKGFGARLNYTWKNYAGFNPVKSYQDPSGSSEVRLANTNALYLGFYIII